MTIDKERLKKITIDGIEYNIQDLNKEIRFLEDNGLELCAEWLENEIIAEELDFSQKQKIEYIDYMVKVFYEKIDNILPGKIRN